MQIFYSSFHSLKLYTVSGHSTVGLVLRFQHSTDMLSKHYLEQLILPYPQGVTRSKPIDIPLLGNCVHCNKDSILLVTTKSSCESGSVLTRGNVEFTETGLCLKLSWTNIKHELGSAIGFIPLNTIPGSPYYPVQAF